MTVDSVVVKILESSCFSYFAYIFCKQNVRSAVTVDCIRKTTFRVKGNTLSYIFHKCYKIFPSNLFQNQIFSALCVHAESSRVFCEDLSAQR